MGFPLRQTRAVSMGEGEWPSVMACAGFGVVAETALGGRASQNWIVRRGRERLVLRRHRRADWQTDEQLSAAIRWRSQARSMIWQLGWPAAPPIDEPVWHANSWWTLEEYLSGVSGLLLPDKHARLLADFHSLGGVDVEMLGVQPGRLDHLAVLLDDSAEETLTLCADPQDRDWLLLRLAQARNLASQIDWTASRRLLVHGDFAPHNLLFDGDRFTGLLDFELATTDRRIIDMIHVWRCRHDDVLLAYDAILPLGPDEWRMLLVDWWALLVTLALVQLRHGKHPDRWELDGLRRTSAVSVRLEVELGVS